MIFFDKTFFPEVKLFRFEGLSDSRGSKIRLYSAAEYLENNIDFIPKISYNYFGKVCVFISWKKVFLLYLTKEAATYVLARYIFRINN